MKSLRLWIPRSPRRPRTAMPVCASTLLLGFQRLLLMGLFTTTIVAFAQPDDAARRTALAKEILADQTLSEVHRMAQNLLKSGLNAGSGYGEVWIRDLNTFIEVALEVNPPARFREALLTFFKFQGTNGDIVDGYIPMDQAKVKYAYRTSALAPDLMAHKNTVETDQESSLVQAVRKYISVTGDRSILTESIAGATARERLGRALNYVLTERFDPAHGLVWGATTADWGDVQPESPWGVEFDASSHRAIDIYDNAMLLIALNDYLQLLGDNAPEAAHWREIRDHLKQNIRRHLWDARRQKFIPHLYLAGSPFPESFDENAIYYHGGTAVAIEAGLLNHDEIAASLRWMNDDMRKSGAATIGLTMYPPYPPGFFKNPSMAQPYSYQNGGDWSWFGGRMIQQLARNGFVEDAYRELKPMVARVQRVGDFHEWWSRENEPRGSAQFRGSAGVLGRAIEMLLAWAKQNAGDDDKKSAPPGASVETKPVPGVVIDHSPARSGQFIGSPSLAVLPDGTDVASHDFFGPRSTSDRTVVFQSKDRGETWRRLAEIQGQWWSTLFVHRGALYLIGTSRENGFAVIRRSADGGQTWTTPRDADTGLLLADGKYHCAPVPVVEHGGRVWRAMEDVMGPGGWGSNFRAFVLSAPADADLLRAKNWTRTQPLGRNPAWLDGQFGGWLEGNVVITPDDKIADVLRVDVRQIPEKVALIQISADGKTAEFNPATGFIDFPGGAKKFTIRFDPVSRRYWSLTSPVLEPHAGVTPGSIRNALALTSSPDLIHWTIRTVLLRHPDTAKHGFQYADWLFDGDDLIAVVRTAFDDADGGADSFHNANFLTFHRIRNFREAGSKAG